MNKVSVILTTYNSSVYLQQVLDSINNQEGKGISFEIELIVVDDCSTDQTLDILNKNSIKYITTSKNTGGPNHGRNLALSKCTGSYICIVDHDDIWLSNKILSLLSISHLAPIITSGYTLINEVYNRTTERVKTPPQDQDFILYEKNHTFRNKLMKKNRGQETYLGSIMFSSVFKNIFFEEKYGMIDFDWVLKLFHNNSSVEICKSLYLRRLEGKNLSLNENYRINDYKHSLKTIAEFSQDYPFEVRVSEKRINGSMGRYFYLMGNMKKSRKYLLKSTINTITILYLITSFVGHSFVRKHFNIFG